jgi:hypothetical protein
MTLWLDLFALGDCRFARLHECTGSSQWVSTVAEVCDSSHVKQSARELFIGAFARLISTGFSW